MGELSAPRVLVLGTVLGQGRGGVRRHNQELLPRVARLLADAGGSLALLEGREPCAFELPAEIERITSSVPARPALRRGLAEGHALRRLLNERAAQGRPFDLVHTAHQPVPRGFQTPLSLLIHDLRSLDLAHSPFSRRLFARELIGAAARRARVLLTVSEAMADAIAAALHVERAKVRVVPNAADHLEPLPRSVEPLAPLLCIGHLEPRKNQELLIEALAVDPSLPAVEFVGAAKGTEESRLRNLARARHVEARVSFLGPIDDQALRLRLARCAAVVLPSQLEGFGIVALEAQVAGAPLALSAIPAHLEVAPEAPSFANDPRDCARAVRRALALPPSRLEESALLARQRFSWADSAARLLDAWFEG